MNDKDFYKFVLNNVKDGVYFVDKERKITFWNKSAEKITGFSKDEVLNHYCFNNILNHVDDKGCYLCRDGCPLHKTLVDGKERSNTVYLHHKSGHRVESKVFIMPIVEEGIVIGAVETFSENLDEDYLKKNIEKLKTLAYYDQLTSLPNRRYLDDQLALKLAEYKKMKTNFGIAILDVDCFKNFNDTYGHDVGDMVLEMLARVFRNAIRGTDFVGRWGGEEFLAVLTDIDNEKLREILNRFRMLVERSTLRAFTEELKVTISIGGALIREDDTLESLFKRADTMLYKSKNEGRNRVNVAEASNNVSTL